jgi:thiosulfate/3-mercaptopyruvate sulfurtransferase
MRPSRILAALSLPWALATAQSPNPGLLVSTDWLARHLDDPKVVVLHVPNDTMDFAAGHIPGARQLLYADVRIEHNGIGTELPPVEQLQRTFEKLGVSDDSHVVIYAGGRGRAPMASRVFLSLDYLGHPNVSLLDGGFVKWQAEKRAVSTETPRVAAGKLTPRPRVVTVDADFVSAKIGQRGFAFIDTRTTPEYLGTGGRSGLPSEGHVAGARQLEWEQLFSDPQGATFLEPSALKKLYADRVAPGDTVITYCLVGYRASMTYFGARLLGYPVRLYDGSYQEWARLAKPVRKGESP